MEEDLEIIERALLNLETEEKEEKVGNHESLYKNWGKLGNQEERRKQLLDIQKGNRNNKIDKFRGILDLVNAVEENNLFKPFKKVPYRPNIYVAGFHKTCLTYSNVLMLSEWMIEKPGDFSTNWYVVPCPKGTRLLAVANHGTTKFYSKYGQFKFQAYTGLPGGNPYNYYRKHCCVLDCFYHDKTNTLYLLDLLAWNNQPMTDGETEFRQYWMKTQLEDFPDTKTINKKNKVVIKLLPMMPCTTHFLSYLLSTYPQFENNTPPLDGLLFYHKRAHYVAGQTPLVGWLYPYMIPEILGEEITMHPGYLAEKPEGYLNQADFIEKFEAKNNAKKNRRHRSSNTMETDSNMTTNSNKSAVEIKNNETTKAKQSEKFKESIESISMEAEEKIGEISSTSEADKKDNIKESISMEAEEKVEEMSTANKVEQPKNIEESEEKNTMEAEEKIEIHTADNITDK